MLVNFALSFLLLMMLLPASISVLFAKKKVSSFLWNFSWYFIMGSLCSELFDSPRGHYLTIFLMLLYTSRALSNKNTQSFSYYNFGSFRKNPPQQHNETTYNSISNHQQKTSDKRDFEEADFKELN